MTKEERKRYLCYPCDKMTDCFYVNRHLNYKCYFVEMRMEGWELGYKDAIDKACEWVEKFAYNSVITDNIGEREKQAIIISFRQAMEEQL